MAGVRINEFPPLGDRVLAGDDRVPMWHAATNSTVWVDLATLRIFVLSGGEEVLMPPVVNGASLIVTITEVEEGTQRVDIPELAGKNFVLRRRGAGALKPGTEYAALSSGGFILLQPGDILQDEEVFEVDVFTLQGGNNSGAPAGGGGGSLITGVYPITTNTTLIVDNLNQLIQFRGGSNALTLTLPSLTDIPENTVIPIESLINNAKQHRIQTQGGQYIYGGDTASDHLYIGKSEYIHLMAGSDGWYPIAFNGNFFSVGEIVPGYVAGLNMRQLNSGSTGQVMRADYPRIWEAIQSYGTSLVSDSTWLTASVSASNPTRNITRPYRGCFSTGDGSTTFRFPDLQGVALRGLKSGIDAERHNNIAGNYQDGMYPAHTHKQFVNNGSTNTGTTLGAGNSPASRQGAGAGIGNANAEYNITSESGTPTLGNTSDGGGGSETRMENIGINWYIKI